MLRCFISYMLTYLEDNPPSAEPYAYVLLTCFVLILSLNLLIHSVFVQLFLCKIVYGVRKFSFEITGGRGSHLFTCNAQYGTRRWTELC